MAGTRPGIQHGRSVWTGPYASDEAEVTAAVEVERFHPLTHDDSLVRIVCEKKRCKGKRFNLVTPFAGKAFCFTDYMRGLRRLPLADAHVVWWDNSNDPAFQKKLLRTLKDNFDSYMLVEDKNRQHTVETTTEYAKISYRCHRIYKTLHEHMTCPDIPLTVNIEDDVEVPAGTWERLTGVLDTYPEVGTVVGSCRSRRLKDRTAHVPIAFTFERSQSIGGDGEIKVRDRRLVQEKTFGLDAIGAAHMGCWFTRTNLIRRIGMNFGVDGVFGQDLCWGYQLNLAGHKFVIDWSVKTEHYYQLNGEKLSA